MDRTYIAFGTPEMFDAEDREYWNNASYEEKLSMITYLRECFWGPEATTGRIKKEVRIVRMGEADDAPMDKETTDFFKSTRRIFKKAVKEAIAENKKFGIDESELHPRRRKNHNG